MKFLEAAISWLASRCPLVNWVGKRSFHFDCPCFFPRQFFSCACFAFYQHRCFTVSDLFNKLQCFQKNLWLPNHKFYPRLYWSIRAYLQHQIQRKALKHFSHYCDTNTIPLCSLQVLAFPNKKYHLQTAINHYAAQEDSSIVTFSTKLLWKFIPAVK